MRETPTARTAVVRAVPTTFDRCIQPYKAHEPIDVALAIEQHERYCEALADAGLSLQRVPADDRYPDCCFVEDPALVIGSLRIVTRMGAESRRGEGDGIVAHLNWKGEAVVMEGPATLEGGDVLAIERRIYVGSTERTNAAGIECLRRVAEPAGYEVIPVRMGDILHLKSAVAFIGGEYVVTAPGAWEASAFAEFRHIEVPPEEAYAANCRAVNGRVLMPAGYPRAREAIEAAGFDTVEVPTSEFRKAGGGVSCLSIVF